MWDRDVLDEVALEGLDGVTLDTLWTRLEKRSGFPLNMREDRVREYVWRAVLCNPSMSSLSFFLLPVDRPPLVWHDRFQNVSAAGMFIEDSEPELSANYPLSIVSGRTVRGSCKDIDVREDVTAEMYANRQSLPDVMDLYGSKLVMVADQDDRNKALGLFEVDPFMFVSDRVYCFLELVGRRRQQGLATIGTDAAVVGIDSKTAFYYRKHLLKKRIISKTHFHLVTKGKTSVMKGSLLFLPRFHKKIFSPIEQAALKISNLLLTEVDHECEHVVLRDKIDQTSKRMFSHVFTSFAVNFECFMKEAKQGQGIVRKKVVRLLKPVELDSEDKEDSDGEDADGDDDEAEEGADVCDESLEKARLYDPTRILADRTMLSQVLMAIEQSESGMSLMEIGTQLNLTKLDSRMLTRLLNKSGKVHVVKEEQGRTRVSRYCSVSRVNHADVLFESARNGLQLQQSLETIVKLKRANIILDTLHKVDSNIVFSVHHFVKEIRRIEGPGKICDPKSVRRLLKKLEEDGRLKVHQFDSLAGERAHSVQVITMPELASDDPLLKGKVDSFFFRLNNKNSKESEARHRAACKGSAKKKSLVDKSVDEGLYKYNPSVGRKKYGCQAKMRKIFTLYKFLFHQLRVAGTRQEQCMSCGDWRDHILPMSDKSNRVPIRDLVPRIPVSVFCRMVNITYEIPGLVELLQDPTKQNVPLNQAPDVITRGLLFARKYAYNILTLLTFLVGMGLAELGNADAQDKDAVTVKVLNKFAFTHMGHTDKYTFSSVEDVEKCEEEMAIHCQSSCSGCSLPENLFAHQTRNWYDGPRIKPMHMFPVTIRSDSSMEIIVIPPATSLQPGSMDGMQNVRGKGGQKRNSQRTAAASPRKKRRSSKRADSSVPEVASENVSPRKRRSAMDDKDKHALSILNRRRCIWSQQEDNFLLLCRVATLLLRQENIMYINARIVRDEMHRMISHSRNKTTNAIRRRILYMLKDHRTRQNVLDWVSEFRQDDTFAEIDLPVAPKTNEEVWNAIFMDTMTKVLNKFANPREERSGVPLLALDEQSLRLFDLVDYLGSVSVQRSSVFVDPKNCVDIYVNAVENVLISSLILSNDGTPIDEKYSYALFKIYQRYPDSLIRSVVTKLKKNNVMALSKKNKTQEHSLLKNRGVTPYKLSQHYSFLLQTKFAMDSLIRSIDLTVPFHNSEERCDASAVVSLLTSREAKFTVSIPEDFIALDKDNPFAKSAIREPRDILLAGDKRCSSRSVLYAFREQLSLNTKQPRDKIQDYLVLNKCTVSVHSMITSPLSDSFAVTVRDFLAKPVTSPVVDPESGSDVVRLIYSRKELGCTRQEIESSAGAFPAVALNELAAAGVVYRVGVNSFRWVHRNFLGPWLVRSVSKIPPASSDMTERRQLRESQHDIEYIAKVWRRPSGEPDTSILYKLMAAIVGHVMTYPGIAQDAILSHFRISAPATQLLEVLELLIGAGCVSVSLMSSRPKTRLFSPVSSCSLFEGDDSQRLDDDARSAERFFEITPNGILILSQIRGELAQSGTGVGGGT